MFFYGRPEIYTLIRRYDTYFTTQNFDGAIAGEDEQRHKYSDGGPARTPDPDVLAYLDNVIATSKSAAARASAQKYKNKLTNFKSRTVLENFKRMNLVAQMKHETFAAGRKLGQKSKSPKKQAAARANGKKAIEKIGKKYYAEIDYADGYKEIEFASGVDCFKYFSGANGKDKIFKNYSDFSRTMAKNNGEYEYKTGKMSVVIRVLGLIKPTSKNNSYNKEEIGENIIGKLNHKIVLTSGFNHPQNNNIIPPNESELPRGVRAAMTRERNREAKIQKIIDEAYKETDT